VRSRAALGLLLAAGLLAGCGSSQPPGNRIRGRTLTIYFSGPLHGASSLGGRAALNGARLALAENGTRIGPYRIRLRVLDDSTLASNGWDPNQTTLDARLAAQDPRAVGYLGDLNSGASAISIPILNRVGIPHISPGSAAVGLTTTGPGAAPGEPQKYYPSGRRTFVRVVPTDASQASALIEAEQSAGCRSTFVLEDGEVDGEDAALTFLLTAQSAGLRVVAVQAFARRLSDYTGLAQSVAASGADCVLVSAIDEASAVRLTQQVARALPRATIFATGGLADGAFLDPRLGGLPAKLDSRLIVVSPMLPPGSYPRVGRAFLAGYARRFGAPPPPAIFGFQSMKLMLDAIGRATDDGHKLPERSKVRAELFSGRLIQGVLGAFRIDAHGDISLRSFGIYRVSGGRLTLVRRAG
jgi:branched-chain amino acid transport system substrate-binding protein